MSLNIHRKNQQGFTIVELLIVIFVSTALLIGFFALYSWHSKIFSYQQAVISATEESRAVGQTMLTSVLQADLVLASSTINGTNYVTSSTTVLLRLPSLDTQGGIILNTWDTVMFYLSGEKLFYTLSPDVASSRLGVNKLLSNGVNSFFLNYDNADFSEVQSLKVYIHVIHTAQNGSVANGKFEQTMRLRNY